MSELIALPEPDGWLIPVHNPACAAWGSLFGSESVPCTCNAQSRPWFRDSTVRAALTAQADTIETLTAERDALLLAEEAANLAFVHLVREKHEVERSEANLRKSLGIVLEQNKALQAERYALHEDAERYRWLKSNRVSENEDGDKCVYFWCDFEHYNDVDAAIDAKRKDAL